MSEVRMCRTDIYVNYKHQKAVSHLPSGFLTDDFLDYASQKMCFSENRSSRKYIDVDDTLVFTMLPGRARERLGPAREKPKCFHVAFRYARKRISLPVHLHVEAEFQNSKPGFRTNKP